MEIEIFTSLKKNVFKSKGNILLESLEGEREGEGEEKIDRTRDKTKMLIA